MNVRYPARETVNAFGGYTAASKAMGIPISTMANWVKGRLGDDGPDRPIPRWWTPAIEDAAKKHGVKLPRPKKARAQ
jgi:hypothetical protein